MNRPESWGGRLPEKRYVGLDPLSLAQNANTLWQKKKEERKPVSKPVALGLAMKSEGREMLKEVFFTTRDQAVAPDINSAIRGLSK